MSTSASPSGVADLRPARHGTARLWPALRGFLARSRRWVHRHPRLRAPYRALVAVAGLTVIVVGLLLVPLPGPGWLIVFVGVAILGTEFPAAHRLTRAVRRMVRGLARWWRARRPRQAEPAAVPRRAA
jgi:uncharacterized protein (TIGR02611 family)